MRVLTKMENAIARIRELEQENAALIRAENVRWWAMHSVQKQSYNANSTM